MRLGLFIWNKKIGLPCAEGIHTSNQVCIQGWARGAAAPQQTNFSKKLVFFDKKWDFASLLKTNWIFSFILPPPFQNHSGSPLWAMVREGWLAPLIKVQNLRQISSYSALASLTPIQEIIPPIKGVLSHSPTLLTDT